MLVLLALGVPFASNLSRRVDAEVKTQASGQASLIAATAAGRLRSDAALERIVREAAGQVRGRVIVVDGRGRLLADSSGPGLRTELYADRPELARALRGETAQGVRYSSSLREDLLYSAVPVVRDARTEGAVRVTQSIEAVRGQVRRNLVELVRRGAGGSACRAHRGVAHRRLALAALRSLARSARRVSGGELEHRAQVEGSTEQRELAEAFNDMTERLGRALTGQRKFVANASHQLRTPLTGLTLRLESATARAEDTALRRDLEAAEAEAERLSTLLTDLLTLAGGAERTGRPASASLPEAVEAAHERWAAPAEQAGIALDIVPGPQVGACISREDLAVVLDHLVDNALKYSPSGTRVTVGWSSEAADTVRLAVNDQGPGLAEDERSRVFDRFYRGRSRSDAPPGTGLGLSIVETLARRWKGGAGIENRPGGGACARVVLPAASERLDGRAETDAAELVRG